MKNQIDQYSIEDLDNLKTKLVIEILNLYNKKKQLEKELQFTQVSIYQNVRS